MAHEKGSPNLPLIAFFAVLSIVTLALLQPAFMSYFRGVTGEQQYVQQEANPDYYNDVREHQDAELEALESGRVPIARAMKMVAEQRDKLPQISPQPWHNREALAGWGAHPDFEAIIDPPAPPAEQLPTPAPVDGASSEDGAGGVPLRQVQPGGERAPER